MACKKQSRAPDLVTKDKDEVLHIYCSEDINIAEQALLSYRQRLLEARTKQVKGIRYDAAIGMVDARLFLIYVKKSSPKADELYPKLVDHFNRERVYGGQSPTNFTRKTLIEGIEELDTELNVKWKHRHLQGE